MTGQIETCRLHAVTFAEVPGESTVDLVARYTAWRETHQGCVLPEPASPAAETEGRPPTDEEIADGIEEAGYDGPVRPEPELFNPDWAVHPGETLAELLDEQHLSARLAAKALSWPVEWVNQVAISQHDITPEMAADLARVFSIPAGFWLNMQTRFTAWRERQVAAVGGD